MGMLTSASKGCCLDEMRYVHETFGSIWLLESAPQAIAVTTFLFIVIVVLAGGVSALPGPCLWNAGGAVPLCPGLPQANASRGRRREHSCCAEPDADRRPNQHRLGGLGPEHPRPDFGLPTCLDPIPPENIRQHARTLAFFKPHAVGLDAPGLTHSDPGPLGQERAARCPPTGPR